MAAFRCHRHRPVRLRPHREILRHRKLRHAHNDTHGATVNFNFGTAIPSGTAITAATTSQQSTPRALVAGQRYYVELLHKENTGADHWSVAWMKPGDAALSIIPGTVLMMPGTELATPSTSNYFNTLATEQPRLGVTRERFAWLKQAYLSPTPSAAKTRAQAVISLANTDLPSGTSLPTWRA